MSVVFVTNKFRGGLLQVLDDPEVRPHTGGRLEIFEMVGDMNHTLPPICICIALAFESLVVTKGTDGICWEGNFDEVGYRMGDPRLNVHGVKANITSQEEEFAWQVIAMVIRGGHELLCEGG